MPRKLLIRSNQFPYHLTARSNNREWFYLPMPDTWAIFQEVLKIVRDRYQLSVHCVVLMSNHFHLIASTPQSNLGECMNYLMREMSKEIGRKSGRINRIFGARYHWSVIASGIYYGHAYKYLFRNPVEAGVVRNAELYPYSSLRSELVAEGEDLRTEPNALFDHLLPEPGLKRLAWLNTPYKKIQAELIRRGLRRTEFQFTRQASLSKEVAYLKSGEF